MPHSWTLRLFPTSLLYYYRQYYHKCLWAYNRQGSYQCLRIKGRRGNPGPEVWTENIKFKSYSSIITPKSDFDQGTLVVPGKLTSSQCCILARKCHATPGLGQARAFALEFCGSHLLSACREPPPREGRCCLPSLSSRIYCSFYWHIFRSSFWHWELRHSGGAFSGQWLSNRLPVKDGWAEARRPQTTLHIYKTDYLGPLWSLTLISHWCPGFGRRNLTG